MMVPDFWNHPQTMSSAGTSFLTCTDITYWNIYCLLNGVLECWRCSNMPWHHLLELSSQWYTMMVPVFSRPIIIYWNWCMIVVSMLWHALTSATRTVRDTPPLECSDITFQIVWQLNTVQYSDNWTLYSALTTEQCTVLWQLNSVQCSDNWTLYSALTTEHGTVLWQLNMVQCPTTEHGTVLWQLNTAQCSDNWTMYSALTTEHGTVLWQLNRYHLLELFIEQCTMKVPCSDTIETA